MAKHKTHFEDCDVLVVGGGMAGTGATFEARHWGRDLKIVCVEKANIDTQERFRLLVPHLCQSSRDGIGIFPYSPRS